MILFENTAGTVTSYCALIPISGVSVPEIDSLGGNPPPGISALRFTIMIARSPLFIPFVFVIELSGSCTAITPKYLPLVLSIIV